MHRSMALIRPSCVFVCGLAGTTWCLHAPLLRRPCCTGERCKLAAPPPSYITLSLRSVFLVFEYCHHDLARLMDIMPKSFSESEVKGLMLQVGAAGLPPGQQRTARPGTCCRMQPLWTGALCTAPASARCAGRGGRRHDQLTPLLLLEQSCVWHVMPPCVRASPSGKCPSMLHAAAHVAHSPPGSGS
jgi:hypothetical protein